MKGEATKRLKVASPLSVFRVNNIAQIYSKFRLNIERLLFQKVASLDKPIFRNPKEIVNSGQSYTKNDYLLQPAIASKYASCPISSDNCSH